MTLVLSINSPNRAMVLFVQMPFNAAKRSVLGCALQVEQSWIEGARFVMVKDIYVTAMRYFSNSFGQPASCTGRCHSIREAIQHRVLQICFLAYTNHTSGKIKLTPPANSHTTVLLVSSLNFGLLTRADCSRGEFTVV